VDWADRINIDIMEKSGSDAAFFITFVECSLSSPENVVKFVVTRCHPSGGKTVWSAMLTTSGIGFPISVL